MQLFQTQKNLLAEAIRLPSGGLEKSNSPSDPAQYLVMRTSGKSLEVILSTKEVSIRVRIDKAGDLLKINSEGTFVVKGDVLKEILLRSIVRDTVSVDFEKSAGETIKGASPEDAPVSLLGNMVMSWSNDVDGKEVWTIPVVDTASIDVPTNPNIDLKGTDRLTVQAGQFAKHIRQVGIAVGKDTGDSKYRNLLIRTNGKLYETVGATLFQLAIVKAEAESASGTFSMLMPYSHAFLATKLLNPERDVEIIYNKGTPGTVVFCQDVVYGGGIIGTAAFRINCASDPFIKFEKVVSSLSFCNSVKMKTQQIRAICNKLDIINLARTEVVLDKKKNALMFSKKEAGRGASKGLGVPVTDIDRDIDGDIKGDDFAFEVSSAYLSQAVNNAELDEIVWKFSGKTSLTFMKLSDNMVTYFSPMQEQ